MIFYPLLLSFPKIYKEFNNLLKSFFNVSAALMEAKLHLVVEFAFLIWTSYALRSIQRNKICIHLSICTQLCHKNCDMCLFILLTLTLKPWHSALDYEKCFNTFRLSAMTRIILLGRSQIKSLLSPLSHIRITFWKDLIYALIVKEEFKAFYDSYKIIIKWRHVWRC